MIVREADQPGAAAATAVWLMKTNIVYLVNQLQFRGEERKERKKERKKGGKNLKKAQLLFHILEYHLFGRRNIPLDTMSNANTNSFFK